MMHYKSRKGDTYPHDMDFVVNMVVGVISQESEYHSEFMRLLRPEEKEWLTATK